MPTECPEKWQPSDEEIEYLAAFGSRQNAILAIGDMDGIDRWRLGELAGLSGGVTPDIEQRKRNWASAAYKKLKHRKQTLPPIVALQQQLEIFRAVGSGKSKSVSHRQTIERLDYLILHAEPNQSISAAKAKHMLTGKKDDVTTEQFLSQIVRSVGPERAKRGLGEFGLGYIVHRAPHLFEVKPDDIETRMAALEQHVETDHERTQTGPTGGAAGDDARSPDGRGPRRVREAPAPAVDGGHREPNRAVGGVREREPGEPDGARDGDGGKVSADDEAAMQQWQRSIGL